MGGVLEAEAHEGRGLGAQDVDGVAFKLGTSGARLTVRVDGRDLDP